MAVPSSPRIAAAAEAVRALSDTELVASLDRFARTERGSIVDFLLHLQELDKRRIVARGPHPSLFSYLTRRLGFSESSAWKRVCAARTARRFPLILEMLGDGRLHLEHVVKLAPYLSWENHEGLLAAASGKSKREVDLIVAAVAPRPARRDVVRLHAGSAQRPGADGGESGTASGRSPDTRGCAGPGTVVSGHAGGGQAAEGSAAGGPPSGEPGDQSGSSDEGEWDEGSGGEGEGEGEGEELRTRVGGERSPDRVEPLSNEWVRIAFCASPAVLPKLEKAKGLLKHRFPGGRMEDVFNELLDVFLALRDSAQRAERRLRRLQRAASGASVPPAEAVSSPPAADAPEKRDAHAGKAVSRTGIFNLTRRVPQWVREAVWMRDGGRCAFVSPEGVRCEERGGLELDHVIPFAMGGRSDDPRNVRLLCREHNQAAARDVFGEAAVEEMKARKRRQGEADGADEADEADVALRESG